MPKSKDKRQTIQLNVVLFGENPDQLFTVRIASDGSVSDLRQLVRKNKLPTLDAISHTDIKLCRVDLSGFEQLPLDAFMNEIRRVIPAKGLPPATLIRTIFPSGSPEQEGKIHIIAVLPDDVQGLIQDHLEHQHNQLFRRLKVSVARFGSWAESDITKNLKGGVRFDPGTLTRAGCKTLFDIEAEMACHRVHVPPVGPENLGSYLARDLYPDWFATIYTTDPVSVNVDTSRVFHDELTAFFSILQRYLKEAAPTKKDKSSAGKSNYLAGHFMLPPFQTLEGLAPTGFECRVEMPWKFPIFITVKDLERSYCKYVPKPDIMVESTEPRCPLVTSEVISLLNKSDRTRMLLQAIALARAGQYLINDGERFFVVAIYLDAQLIAERYIVSQTEADSSLPVQTGPEEKVYICQKNFDLAKERDAILFFREMHNLASKLEKMAGEFDPTKKDLLTMLADSAVGLRSLTASKAPNSQKPRTNTLEDIGEGEENDAAEAEENDEGSGTDDDSTVFDAADIQTTLTKMGYNIDFPLFGHPFVAMVSSKTDDSIGFIKFVPEGRKETQILQYLLGIDSPQNHTIAGAQVWPVHGGQVISMPVGGGWLTDMRNVDAQLWSVAEQLIEAVNFMHQHGVAHLDLKPANILIPKDGGRLSIIDFHTSRRIKGAKTTLHGIVGTPKYIPPEVEAKRGWFSALRADLWSCGKVLSELCDLCQPSMDRTILHQIARELMDKDPEKRPMMSDVLGRMAAYKDDTLHRADSLELKIS